MYMMVVILFFLYWTKYRTFSIPYHYPTCCCCSCWSDAVQKWPKAPSF